MDQFKVQFLVIIGRILWNLLNKSSSSWLPPVDWRQNDIIKRPCKASDNSHFFKVVLADALKEQKFVSKNYSNIQSFLLRYFFLCLYFQIFNEKHTLSVTKKFPSKSFLNLGRILGSISSEIDPEKNNYKFSKIVLLLKYKTKKVLFLKIFQNLAP